MQFFAREHGRALGYVEGGFRIMTRAHHESIEVLNVVLVAGARWWRSGRSGLTARVRDKYDSKNRDRKVMSRHDECGLNERKRALTSLACSTQSAARLARSGRLN